MKFKYVPHSYKFTLFKLIANKRTFLKGQNRIQLFLIYCVDRNCQKVITNKKLLTDKCTSSLKIYLKALKNLYNTPNE